MDDLIDFTPELREEAEAIVSAHEHGPLGHTAFPEGDHPGAGDPRGSQLACAAADPRSGWRLRAVDDGLFIMLQEADETEPPYPYIGRVRPTCRGPRGCR